MSQSLTTNLKNVELIAQILRFICIEYKSNESGPELTSHSQGGPYGENIAEGYASTTDSCQAWGDEYKEYSWSNPGFSEATGHFTQLVWKDSQQVGCGRAFCGANNGWYVVCEYQPVGNVIGSFAQQVGILDSQASPASTTTKATQTIPKQTVAAATVSMPVFTGAAVISQAGLHITVRMRFHSSPAESGKA